jgi:hypothetical protein
MGTPYPAARETRLRLADKQHGSYFRAAALVTIGLGFALHLFRVIAGDEVTLHYVVTPTMDKLLLIPMIYAAVTGWLVWHHVRFANRRHRIAVTAALVYITVSVPLHIWFSFVRQDVSFFVEFFPPWFSYLLLVVVYPVFLTLFWRLRYKQS